MRSMVEGRAGQTLRNNHSNHPIQLGKDIACGNPHHGKPVRFKIALPQAINPLDLAAIVNVSVDFDQQPRRQASEVRNIASNWMLAAKLESIWPSTEGFP